MARHYDAESTGCCRSVAAERDVAAAQAILQAAHDKLRPAVDAAMIGSNAGIRVFSGACRQSAVGQHILDSELLQREQTVVRQLSEVIAELKPFLADRSHKQHSLGNAEFNLAKLESRKEGDWPSSGPMNPLFWRTRDLTPAEQLVEDLRSQVEQLDSAIAPRLERQPCVTG